jgi:acylphosphatase
MKKQAHVYYSGRVQGIGFRYAVYDIASRSRIDGWVKNLEDFRVEAIAEAEEDLLKIFLEEIRRRFFQQIENADIEWLPATGEFRDFRVRY